MLQTILVKVGFFLFEVGANILMNIVFGKDNKKNLENFINSLESENLTGEQKFKKAKEFINKTAKGAPEIAKNIAIETIVSKTNKQAGKLLGKFKD